MRTYFRKYFYVFAEINSAWGLDGGFFAPRTKKRTSGKPKNLPEAPKVFHNGFSFGLATADVSNAGTVIRPSFASLISDPCVFGAAHL